MKVREVKKIDLIEGTFHGPMSSEIMNDAESASKTAASEETMLDAVRRVGKVTAYNT